MPRTPKRREQTEAVVLDEPYSQLRALSGVAVQAGTVSSLCRLAWWACTATPLSWIS
jgi:hypothetical protein